MTLVDETGPINTRTIANIQDVEKFAFLNQKNSRTDRIASDLQIEKFFDIRSLPAGRPIHSIL